MSENDDCNNDGDCEKCRDSHDSGHEGLPAFGVRHMEGGQYGCQGNPHRGGDEPDRRRQTCRNRKVAEVHKSDGGSEPRVYKKQGDKNRDSRQNDGKTVVKEAHRTDGARHALLWSRLDSCIDKADCKDARKGRSNKKSDQSASFSERQRESKRKRQCEGRSTNGEEIELRNFAKSLEGTNK